MEANNKISMTRQDHLSNLLMNVPKEVLEFMIKIGSIYDDGMVERDGKKHVKGKIFLPFVFEGIPAVDEPFRLSHFLDKENECVLEPYKGTYSGMEERINGRYPFTIVPKS